MSKIRNASRSLLEQYKRFFLRAKDLLRSDIFLLVGGFHLGGKSKDELKKIVSSLKKTGVQTVGPCHCTGDAAKEVLIQKYQENFLNIGVGKVIK